jgi:hypothetical protein
MKSTLLFLFVVVKSLSAGNFYVSEIFLSTGSPRDFKNQWLELHNISKKALIINKIKIEIQENTQRPLIIETIFDAPIFFDDRLIIARQKDLALSACLNKEITQIALKEFHINKAKKIKICISLNEESTACLNLTSALFNQASSFYRTDHNLWLSEPCQLVPGIYATPGLPEKSCIADSDIFLDLLNNCDARTTKYSSIFFTHKKSHKNFIKSASIDSSNNLNVRFFDSDINNLLRLSLCSAPATSKLICHELDQVSEYSTHGTNKLRVFARDLVGSSDSAELTVEASKKGKHTNIIKTGKNSYKLKLDLRAEELPVNIKIVSPGDEILAQQAFVKPGIHYVPFSTQDSAAKISLISKNNTMLTNLNLPNEPAQISSCRTHDANFAGLLVYIIFILRCILKNLAF